MAEVKQGMLEKICLFLGYMVFQINICFLSLRIVCSNYAPLDTNMMNFKYVKVFGLLEMVIYPSLPFLFGSLTSAGLAPCLRNHVKSATAYNLLVVLGMCVMLASIWLQDGSLSASTDDAVRKQQLSMFISQLLIGIGSALVTQACHSSLLGASLLHSSEQL